MRAGSLPSEGPEQASWPVSQAAIQRRRWEKVAMESVLEAIFGKSIGDSHGQGSSCRSFVRLFKLSLGS